MNIIRFNLLFKKIFYLKKNEKKIQVSFLKKKNF